MPVKIQLTTPHIVSRAFPIPILKRPRRINTKGLDEFWDRNEWGDWPGCYIFALGWGDKALVPWYVGKTGRTFSREAFEPHKLQHYNEVLRDHPNKSPAMLFVSKKGWKGKPGDRPFDFAETELIRLCAQVNPEIRNEKKVKIKTLLLEGVTDNARGRKTAETADFRKMLSAGI